MSEDPGFLASIWHPLSAFSGLAGGIVGAWADNKASLKVWALYGAAGLLTANFLGQDAMRVIPYVSEGGAGFIVGGCALSLIILFRNIIAKWQPPPPRTQE